MATWPAARSCRSLLARVVEHSADLPNVWLSSYDSAIIARRWDFVKVAFRKQRFFVVIAAHVWYNGGLKYERTLA